MTEFINTVVDPERPWSFIPDTEENILHDLEHYTLDPAFEDYGDFVNRSPEWLDEIHAEKYKGCTVISGNFLTLSHAFYLVTDDEGMISRISVAVERNKNTTEYQAARARRQQRPRAYHIAADASAKTAPAGDWQQTYLFN